MNVGPEKADRMICDLVSARQGSKEYWHESRKLSREESETRRDGEKERRLTSSPGKFKEQMQWKLTELTRWLVVVRIQRGD